MDEDDKINLRSETSDLAPEYANNCRLEPSVWDIKVFFGQYYQFPKPEVDWHTAVTLPWLQAKLLAHFLEVNIALFEYEHGKISVPGQLRPPLQEGPGTEATELVKKLHDEFFGITTEVVHEKPPGVS